MYLIIYFGLLLLALVPSIGVIGMVKNVSISAISTQLFRFCIICQIIVVLLPVALYLFTFLYIGERESPQFLPDTAFFVTCIAICCIFLSIVSNIAYAVIDQQKRAIWGIMFQIFSLCVGFYLIYFGAKWIP